MRSITNYSVQRASRDFKLPLSAFADIPLKEGDTKIPLKKGSRGVARRAGWFVARVRSLESVGRDALSAPPQGRAKHCYRKKADHAFWRKTRVLEKPKAFWEKEEEQWSE